ncbi:MAG TPA: VWA domain-containing protein [Gemmatimonadaceae bacterium]|jgi:nitric oxide reductase NorD protein|nr:VWA domain-containing protein [Gemmatimonadaceae bacterium]
MVKRSFVRTLANAARRSARPIVGGAARLVHAGRSSLPRARRRSVVRLDEVRRRLELLVTAVYDRPIPIATVEPPKRRRESLWDRLVSPRHLRSSAVLPSTDGVRIHLPREIEGNDVESAVASYRLLAVQQAERIARGTPVYLDPGMTPLERDLYLAREGAEIDVAIARNVPGLRSALAAARAMALAARPPFPALTAVERAVESIVQRFLASDVAAGLTRGPSSVDSVPDSGRMESSPAASLAWAREQAASVSALGGRYRGLPPVFAWGTVKTPRVGAPQLRHAYSPPTLQGGKYGLGRIGRGSGQGGNQSSESGVDEGTTDDPRKDGKPAPDSRGKERPATGSGGQPIDRRRVDDAMESESDGRETTDEASANSAGARSGVGRPDELARTRRRVPEPKVVGDSIEYPEWDWRAGDYATAGAVVHTREPEVSDDSWGNDVLAKHGPLVRRLRERFERLRARRVRLNQQRDGDALDLAACVRAMVDQRTGHRPDDRLYLDVRSARRGLAICLLIDISGSTDEWIDNRRRVIDVEKVALLLASEALDALGDAYAILTFSGKGRTNVRMRTIKSFEESNGALVRRRMAALQPEGYTRAGPAIRHAAAVLERQRAAHRLLLVISDGKPNDVDAYEGLYGVEDTRQAINEARTRGVYPFCLTIDRQGQEYLSRIFGEAGHAVLRNPAQLPVALVKVVRHLLAS